MKKIIYTIGIFTFLGAGLTLTGMHTNSHNSLIDSSEFNKYYALDDGNGNGNSNSQGSPGYSIDGSNQSGSAPYGSNGGNIISGNGGGNVSGFCPGGQGSNVGSNNGANSPGGSISNAGNGTDGYGDQRHTVNQ